MKSYVIRHVEGGYLYKSQNARWERTQNSLQAERLPHDKAINVLNNCIGPTMRKYWEIVCEDALEQPDAVNSTPEHSGGFNWEEISHAQYSLYSGLMQYGEELREQLSAVDLEICDIQHYIEFFSLDAAKGYKAYKMLKQRLERRRHIKDEMAKVNCFLGGNPGDFSSGKISRQISAMDNCRYTPRVLNELFGMDAKGGQLPHVS